MTLTLTLTLTSLSLFVFVSLGTCICKYMYTHLLYIQARLACKLWDIEVWRKCKSGSILINVQYKINCVLHYYSRSLFPLLPQNRSQRLNDELFAWIEAQYRTYVYQVLVPRTRQYTSTTIRILSQLAYSQLGVVINLVQRIIISRPLSLSLSISRDVTRLS